MGDLNFRLDDSIGKSSKDIIDKLAMDEDLFKNDRLTQLRRNEGAAFVEMEEQEVDFKPTYKFKAGTKDYNAK